MSSGFTVLDQPDMREIAALEAEIDAFNLERSGIHDARWLSIVLHDDSGALRAGLHGFTWGGYCEIRLLWVAEAERERGLGSGLLAAAEREAAARGCGHIILSTHSFQAPDFYARHGYATVARIEDSPRGHAHHMLVKYLAR